jgi:hypothetical protein
MQKAWADFAKNPTQGPGWAAVTKSTPGNDPPIGLWEQIGFRQSTFSAADADGTVGTAQCQIVDQILALFSTYVPGPFVA